MSATVAGSKIVMSACAPGWMSPRSVRPKRAAGRDVIFRTASSSGTSFFSRTNSPSTFGKQP